MKPTEKYPSGNDRVEAVFSPPVDPMDEGNILIEALPEWTPYKSTMWSGGMTKNPSGAEVPFDRRIREPEHLKDDSFRFPMKNDEELRRRFREMMEISYRRRWPYCTCEGEKAYLNGQEIEVGNIQEEIVGGDTNTALAFIGISGSGKSKTVKYLLNEYPRLIVHKTEQSIMLQIPYIYVEAQTNDDMSTMYMKIARFIDNTLNTRGRYEKLLDRGRLTVNRKGILIADLIRTFHVGIVVVDEIQKMSISQKKGSLESLDEIINSTKVAMMSVGTEESFSRIFQDAHRARRQGKPIHASKYCSNYNEFRNYVIHLYKYQWFPYHVEPTEDMIMAHYETSCGTIGGLLDIYIEMNKKSMENDRFVAAHPGETAPPIDRAFIEKVALEYNPGQMERLREAMRNDRLADYEGVVQRPGDDNVSKPVVAIHKKPISDIVYDSVSEYFKDNGSKYNPSTIIKCVNRAMKLKDAPSMTVEDLVKKAIDTVERGTTDVRKHQRISPMADADTDNYKVPSIV